MHYPSAKRANVLINQHIHASLCATRDLSDSLFTGGYPEMDFDDLSIVVLWFDRKELSRATSAALIAELGATAAELIIVDNGSSDGSTELLRRLARDIPSISPVYCHRNMGVAEGRNRGFARATRPFILSLDNDILINRTAIVDLIRKMRSEPNIGILSPKIINAYTGKLMNSYAREATDIISFYEACFMMRTSLLNTVGWLDEGCFHGGEGLDYGLRVTDAGYRVCSIPLVRVRHIEEDRGVTPQDCTKRLRWARAFSRVYSKNFPLPSAVLFCFRNTISHLWHGVGKCGPGFMARLFMDTYSGFVDGLKVRDTVGKATLETCGRVRDVQNFGNRSLGRSIGRKIKSIVRARLEKR